MKVFSLACTNLTVQDCLAGIQNGAKALLDRSTNFNSLASLLRHHGRVKALANARCIHAQMTTYGLDQSTFLGNYIVEMYGNCGSLVDAQVVFNNLRNPNLYSHNILMKAYGQNGSLEDAQSVFDAISMPDLYSWTILINAYGQHGNVDDASSVFHKMPHRNVISYTAMVTALVRNGHAEEALNIYHQMLVEGVSANNVTFVCVFDACASLTALQKGQQIHIAIVDTTLEQDVVVATAVLNMYGKCGNVCMARNVFDRMLDRDVVSWNAMITAAAENGHRWEALDLFCQMQLEGLKPNRVTCLCTLDALTNEMNLELGHGIHAAIVDLGCDQDVAVGTSLVNMYSKLGSIYDAKRSFDRIYHPDVVAWNAMIVALVQNDQGMEALTLFQQMKLQGTRPDKITFICVLNASANLVTIDKGQDIHAAIVELGYEHDISVSSALVNMYGKCGNLLDARSMFLMMPSRDVVSWNSIMEACVCSGLANEITALFCNMELHGAGPERMTLVCVLEACASLAALKEGQNIHAIIVDLGYEVDEFMGTALINMYGKCGSPYDALNMFGKIAHPDVVSWTAMIAAFSENGHDKEALYFFQWMQLEGIKPDGVTLLCALTACSHTGQLDIARHLFISMNTVYGIVHTEDQYVCMVDLFGRAGCLDEAEHLINNALGDNIAVAWWALLGACRIHGDTERGLRAASHCIELEPKNAAPYVMMSNIYSAAGGALIQAM